MDASSLSAVAALAGTVAGCATSILTSWFTVHSQTRSQKAESEKKSKALLYERFIDEASQV